MGVRSNAVHLTKAIRSNRRFIGSPPFFDRNFLIRLLTTRGLLRPLLLVWTTLASSSIRLAHQDTPAC